MSTWISSSSSFILCLRLASQTLHRLMLLSSRISRLRIARGGMKADPQDKNYWRMPGPPLEAEPIRDSI